MRHVRWIFLFFLAVAAPRAASAQDVEMLGEHYGTRPPPAYFQQMRADPLAFQFIRGRSRRLRLQSSLYGSGAPGAYLALGPRDGPVEGDYLVPVIMGLYSDSDSVPPFTRSTIASSYFGAQPGTITDYYDEVSNSLVDLQGEVADWQQISKTEATIAGGQSGLFASTVGGGGAGNFVYELLSLQPTSIDWGAYDNDGPDGLPNSGDDDGFVDVVAVIHPTRGAECNGANGRIWSHRWSLSSAVYRVFTTATPRTGAPGQFIRVDDYTIQPAVACAGGGLNQIGVFTHELGHAFGLPDLYDTCTDSNCGPDTGSHAGAGIWDLMASGSWGCDNGSADAPCHMGAWSKAQLGWVDVVQLDPETDYGTVTLPPVETTRTVFRVDASDGSGEYFLLENRQSLAGQSFDQGLFSEGLLVWQIDPDWIASRWGANRVNANAHMGVWLRQADGFDHLGSFRQPRGDGGDPFPGDANASAFHAGTSPASYSFQGGATGLTIQDIALSGDDVTFSLTTELTTISVSASGTTSPDGLFTLNGAPVDPPATTFRSAPFASNLIEASGGEAVSAGVRTSFLRWSDDPAAPRTRTVVAPLSDLDLVAEYGGTQYELAIDVTGGVSGVEPGTFLSSPTSSDLWFAPETEVVLQALPVAGFDFLRWTGDLAGQGNPASIVMTAPASATAEFEVVYGLASTVVDIPAAETQNVQLEVTEGTDPFLWYLVAGPLPEGILMSGSGRLSGAALDYGTYPVTVEVIDDNGLAATGSVTIEVSAPTIGIDALASEFLQTGPELTSLQKEFLDRQGNGVSGYDLGDFRAWLLANPSLELSASVEPAPATRTIVIPRRTPAGGEGNTP